MAVRDEMPVWASVARTGWSLGARWSMKRRQRIREQKPRHRAGRGRKPVFRETTVSIEGRCYRTLLDYYLRVYLDTREYLKRTKQRLAAMDQNTAIGNWPRGEERHYLSVYARRKSELKTCLLRECRKRPEHKWLTTFPGVGPVAEAVLLAKVDIHKAQSVSSLWRFCGLGLEADGTRQRPIKRKKRTYCAFLKAILIHDIGSRVLISTRRSPGHKHSHAVAPQYRALYLRFKAYYGRNRPAWTKPHIHAAAVRRVVKEYVKHLWMRWRQECGLSTTARDVPVGLRKRTA